MRACKKACKPEKKPVVGVVRDWDEAFEKDDLAKLNAMDTMADMKEKTGGVSALPMILDLFAYIFKLRTPDVC